MSRGSSGIVFVDLKKFKSNVEQTILKYFYQHNPLGDKAIAALAHDYDIVYDQGKVTAATGKLDRLFSSSGSRGRTTAFAMLSACAVEDNAADLCSGLLVLTAGRNKLRVAIEEVVITALGLSDDIDGLLGDIVEADAVAGILAYLTEKNGLIDAKIALLRDSYAAVKASGSIN